MSIEARARSRGRLRAGRFVVGVSVSLAALALLFLFSLATNYNYFQDDVGRSATAILTAAAINLATLGLGLASVRQGLRYRRGDSGLTRVGVLEVLTGAGLVLTFLSQLALDHH